MKTSDTDNFVLQQQIQNPKEMTSNSTRLFQLIERFSPIDAHVQPGSDFNAKPIDDTQGDRAGWGV